MSHPPGCAQCIALAAICIRLKQLQRMRPIDRLLDVVVFPRAYDRSELIVAARSLTKDGHRIRCVKVKR